MRAFLFCFLKDRAGATAIEYAIIAAGIAGLIFAVMPQLGVSVLAKYESISTSLE